MAFLVEDGTGTVAGANAYVSVSDADDYHADRGNDEWDGDATEKEQAIVNATDHIDRRWGGRLKAKRLLSDQPLEFPRSGMRDRRGTLVTGIPTKLEQATAEYAIRILEGTELEPDPEYDDSGRSVEREKLKAGPIELDTSLGNATVGTRNYPTADRLMAEYVTSRGVLRA